MIYFSSEWRLIAYSRVFHSGLNSFLNVYKDRKNRLRGLNTGLRGSRKRFSIMTIDEIKAYLESPEGGRFLLNVIAGAKTRENQRFYNSPTEQTYNREAEQERKRQKLKAQLQTPIPISCEKSDLEQLIQFNQEHTDTHQLVLVSNDSLKFIQHSPGHSIPNLPILQSGYFEDILRNGSGIAYDNRKQAYLITLE